jgi:hypothetical protein
LVAKDRTEAAPADYSTPPGIGAVRDDCTGELGECLGVGERLPRTAITGDLDRPAFRRVLALVDEAGALGEELRAELAPAMWERVHAYTGAMIRSALALTAAAKARERERKSGASTR